MKKIILLALASLPAVVFAQDGKFSIQGTIGHLNAPAKVYLRYYSDKMYTDSATLADGKFQFSVPVKSDFPAQGYLMLNQKGTGPAYDDYKSIYLEPGDNTVTGTHDLASAKIKGTKTNEDKSKYDAASKRIDDANQALSTKIDATADDVKNAESFKRDVRKQRKAIAQQGKQVDKEFIQQNPDSYFSLMLLQEAAYSSDYTELQPLYDGLSPKMKETKTAKSFAETLPKLKAVALGTTAPDFAQADTAGKMVSLSSFRGKYVLVDFWASWCGPCRAENPNVVEAYNRYKGQNFTILGVSLDQPGAKAKWEAAIQKDGLTWTEISDLKYWSNEAAGLYGVRAIPQNFLLDPNGKIVAKNLRGDDLDDKLEELFGKL